MDSQTYLCLVFSFVFPRKTVFIDHLNYPLTSDKGNMHVQDFFFDFCLNCLTWETTTQGISQFHVTIKF